MLRPLYWALLVPLALLGTALTQKKPLLARLWLLAVSLLFLWWAQPALWPLTLLMALLAWALPRWGRRGAAWYAALAVLLLAGLKIGRVPWPMGLSFVLLQGIAYGMDVTGGKTAPGTLTDTLTYLTFFPKLPAGPLARFDSFRESRVRLGAENLERGMTLMIAGLGRKLLLADNLRPLAMAAFSGDAHPLAWALSLAGCGLYVYHDFAGATEMARGVALMLGIGLPENFDRPFSALSLRDFWRRWHMSLSGFLRDYLYIPLGGSRKGMPRTLLNLMAVFLVMGLWHGFTWPFLVFGLWHGALVALEHAGVIRPSRWPRILARVYTLAAVLMGFLVFMAPDMGRLFGGVSVSFAARQQVFALLSPLSLGALGLGAALPWLPRVSCPAWLRRLGLLLLLILCYAHLFAAGYAPLLYAQF